MSDGEGILIFVAVMVLSLLYWTGVGGLYPWLDQLAHLGGI